MSEDEKGLITLMESVDSIELRATILSIFIQAFFPLSEECGQRVRELLEGQKA